MLVANVYLPRVLHPVKCKISVVTLPFSRYVWQCADSGDATYDLWEMAQAK